MNKDTQTQFDASFYGPKYWTTWIAYGFMWLWGRLPLNVASGLGDWIGRLLYYIAADRRRITEINIALCFPELTPEQQTDLVKRTLRAVGRNITEGSVSLWGSNRDFQKAGHTVTGLEHIEAAQARGQGVLLVGAHFTTIDSSARVLTQKIPFDVLYRKNKNLLLDYKITEARETFAGSAIVRSDTRQLVRRLREGKVVWYAPDQDYGAHHSVFAPFFGVNAATITATTKIAQLGRAAVVPLSHYRDEKGFYHIVIEPALENFPSGDEVADATRINQVIEVAVRKHPEQYLWVHRRFKTRPPGEPSFYPPKKKKRAN